MKDHEGLHDRIWAAAYGAAYVVDFERCYYEAGRSFDESLGAASAERAETIADHALAEWLRWNREGKAQP